MISHLGMSSNHDYNTGSKETNYSKILDEISKLREELVDNFSKRFIDNKDEIINLKEVIIQNLQNENKRLNAIVNQLQEKIITLESKSNSVEQYVRATQLNNMSKICQNNIDNVKIRLRLMEFLIVFLMTTWSQLLPIYLVMLQMHM